MRWIITTFLLSLFTVSFGQNTIQESGNWCDADLVLTANLEDGATIVNWTKDGIVLEGETGTSINCTTYGKGIYEVTLTADGATGSISHDLSSVAGPVADFSATNYLAAAVTYFEDASISAETITTWNWDFGNGETSAEQNPKIMFTEQKNYVITLVVTTASGCTHTITKEHEWAYK